MHATQSAINVLKSLILQI